MYGRKKTSNDSLATNIDASVGKTDIAELWKFHYKCLLNIVQNDTLKNMSYQTLINNIQILLL